HEIGGRETPFTTAHITAVLDTRFHRLAQIHSRGAIHQVIESYQTAIDTLERIVHAEEIKCQFERVPGYLFAPPSHRSSTELDSELQNELHTLRQLGNLEAQLALHPP